MMCVMSESEGTDATLVDLGRGKIVALSELGGASELAARRGVSRQTLLGWAARSRRGETRYPFPKPVAVLAAGPIYFLPDIDGYTPGDGRWPVG